MEIQEKEYEELIESREIVKKYKAIKNAEKYLAQLKAESNEVSLANDKIKADGEADKEAIKQDIVLLKQSLKAQGLDIEAKKKAKSAELAELNDKLAFTLGVLNQSSEELESVEEKKLARRQSFLDEENARKRNLDAIDIKVADKEKDLVSLKDLISLKKAEKREEEAKLGKVKEERKQALADLSKALMEQASVIKTIDNAKEEIARAEKEQKKLSVSAKERKDWDKDRSDLDAKIADYNAKLEEIAPIKAQLKESQEMCDLKEKALKAEESNLNRKRKELVELKDQLRSSK